MATPFETGLQTLSSLQDARTRQLQQENILRQRQQQDRAQNLQNRFNQLAEAYTQNKDPAMLREMIAINPQMSGQIQSQLGVIDQASRSKALAQAQAFANMLKTAPEQAIQFYSENLVNEPAFAGLADNFANNDIDGALNEIGYGVMAVGGPEAYQAIFGSDEIDGGKVAPVSFKDATAASLSEYRKTGDPGVLVRAPKYSTVTIAGKQYRWNESTGEYDIPVISGEAVDGEKTQALTPEAQMQAQVEQKVEEAKALEEVKRETPEALDKKRKERQFSQDVLSTIDTLEELDVGPVTGGMGRLPTFREQSEDVLVKAKRLQSLLTRENLGIMSGVLSETDMKIISDLAGGFGLVTDNEGNPVRIMGSEQAFYDRLAQIKSIIQRGLSEPPQTGTISWDQL